MREQARSAPQTKTALGGTVRTGRPIVTLTIVALCVVSWLLQRATGGAWTQDLAFAPFIGEVQPYRFLTAAFLHSTSVFHILFNMYALWITGPFLEQMLGRARFIALYTLAAIGGSVGVLLLAQPTVDGGWFTPVVGASGAVFGLFGAILVVLRRLGRNATQILVLIGINFAIGFIATGIAWQAHLGGLVVGLILGAGYAYAPKERRRTWSVVATVVVAVALVALTLVKYSSVSAWVAF